MAGAVSGFPHAHRTTGWPVASTNTAVPACNTDCRGVATPPLNP